jgi:hypothetical protein
MGCKWSEVQILSPRPTPNSLLKKYLNRYKRLVVNLVV